MPAASLIMPHSNGKMTCPNYLRQTRCHLRSPGGYRPATVAAIAQSQTYLSSIDSDIETYLKKAISNIRQPKSVLEPMHHLSFATPGTTAPALCVAACELIGGDRRQAMAAAAAIHLMHAAVHAHVHLLPNPKAANIPHKFKPNIELLTGDGIIPFAVELVAKSSMDIQPDKICRVIMEITQAVGPQGMVDGLYHEFKVLSDQYLSSAGSGSYENMITDEYICKKKEGELHACGAACGAIIGGGTEDDIEKLRKFGLYVGMIRGFMMGKNYYDKPRIQEKLEEFNGLAFKVLESFRGKRNIELISSLVEPCSSYT